MIRVSFKAAFAANDSGRAAELRAQVLQARCLNDKHVLANAVFTVADAKGSQTQEMGEGQCGRQESQQAMLLMEAAFALKV